MDQSIITWLRAATGNTVPVVVMRQNSPQPEQPYIAVGYNAIETIGQSESRTTDVAGEIETFHDCVLRVGVKVIGPGAFSIAKSCRAALARESVLEGFNGDGLGFNDAIQVLDTSLIHPDSARWEEQADFEVSFNTSLYDSEIAAWIENVTGQGEVSGSFIESIVLDINI